MQRAPRFHLCFMLDLTGAGSLIRNVRRRKYETKICNLDALLLRRVAAAGFHEIQHCELDCGQVGLELGILPLLIPERLGLSVPQRLFLCGRADLPRGFSGWSHWLSDGWQANRWRTQHARHHSVCARVDLLPR